MLVGTCIALAIAETRGFASFSWAAFASTAVAGTALCILLLPLWPQIKFKPQMRTLELDEKGYRTQIGRYDVSRLWSEIGRVEDDGETIVLTTRKGNAMLIPRRAFGDLVDRGQVFSDIKKWHVQAV